MSYNPATYWPERFARQGPTYVARGGRKAAWDDERDAIGQALEGVLWRVHTLLDYGCGPGRFADMLARWASTYHGYDIVSGAASLNPYPTIPTVRTRYDLGVAIQVFQHIDVDQRIEDIGAHADAWIVVDHGWIDAPDPHMHPRRPEAVAELLALGLEHCEPVLGHWLGVFR